MFSVPVDAQADGWNGWYLGLTAGQFNGHAQVSTHTIAPDNCSPSSYFCDVDIPQLAAVGEGRFSLDDIALGWLAGYNHQSGHLVLGVETDYTNLNASGSRQPSSFYTEPWAVTNSFTLRQETVAHGLFTLRGRVGYSLDQALFYVTAGAAATRLTLKDGFTDDYSDGASESATRKETKWGWVWGVGAQYALTQRWSLSADYLHANFSDIKAASTNLQAGYFGVTNFYPGNVFHHQSDFSLDILRAGLSYQF